MIEFTDICLNKDRECEIIDIYMLLESILGHFTVFQIEPGSWSAAAHVQREQSFKKYIFHYLNPHYDDDRLIRCLSQWYSFADRLLMERELLYVFYDKMPKTWAISNFKIFFMTN